MYLALPQTNVGANLFASCPPSAATNRQQTRSSKSAECGFTLVELIMVIALAGIVAVMITTVMSRPLQGFADQSRRAELTDLAASALNRMARDIRLAVPNSIVVVNNNELRLLHIAAAGRYRANQPELDGPRMDPPACTQTSADCEIEILSPLESNSSEKHWLIIYPTGPIAEEPQVSVISPKEFTWNNGVLEASLQDFRFKYASPQRRFYLARETLIYHCGGDELLRATSENLDGSSASTPAVVVNAVSNCTFTYEPATNTRNGLVTLRLSLSKDGENITLLQQVHVDNAP
ncbi:prepilin-type N-terminal cleavage/methylation domain-containing protein [Pseudomonas stutzeri]|nr:prepilin-type N-terminal cleavage/methylation domain-containing protein [Stutzerimonas stutzeri]